MADDSNSFYAYSPSKVAPIIFTVLFFFSSMHHIYLNAKYKSWKVTGSMPWAGTVFITGFICREISAYNPSGQGIFIASVVLIFCAPPVYALTNYIILGRTLYYIPYLTPIHPGRVISTFIGLDLIIGVTAGNGAARVANSNATPADIRAGKALIRTSILLQVISFFAFVLLEVMFHRRCLKAGILPPKNKQGKKLRSVLYLMYASSTLISIRHIYRVVDVFQGYTGYLEIHEWPLYIFDGLFMFANALMLNIFHPMRYLPTDNNIFLSQDGITELKGPGWVDKRNFLLTIFDPFDIVGFFQKRDKERFWENENQFEKVELTAPTTPDKSTAKA